jgi:hypothetical protein
MKFIHHSVKRINLNLYLNKSNKEKALSVLYCSRSFNNKFEKSFFTNLNFKSEKRIIIEKRLKFSIEFKS